MLVLVCILTIFCWIHKRTPCTIIRSYFLSSCLSWMIGTSVASSIFFLFSRFVPCRWENPKPTHSRIVPTATFPPLWPEHSQLACQRWANLQCARSMANCLGCVEPALKVLRFLHLFNPRWRNSSPMVLWQPSCDWLYLMTDLAHYQSEAPRVGGGVFRVQ